MKEIKRFDMRGSTWPSDDGSIVSYKDHAAIVDSLQEQVRAMAAEVSECRRFFAEELGPESGIQFAALSTERSDEVIREIRALAVEEYAATVGAVKNGAIYAARIRSGEQP